MVFLPPFRSRICEKNAKRAAKKEKALQQNWMVENFMGKVCQCYLASHEAQRALKMESQNHYFLVLALLVVHDQLAIHELAEARQGKHQPAPA